MPTVAFEQLLAGPQFGLVRGTAERPPGVEDTLRQDAALVAEPGLDARPVTPADAAFLRHLYAGTRADEMAATGWSVGQQQAFLAQQFSCQQRYYEIHFADADFLLLLRHGEPIGRLYWHEQGGRATLIDISLLPWERGRGTGSALLAALAARADRLGLSIWLHVEPENPAVRLYERLGFQTVGSNGVYLKMGRRAARAAGGPELDTLT